MSKFINIIKKIATVVSSLAPVVAPFICEIPLPHTVALGCVAAAHLLHVINHKEVTK